jgi:ABC-type uncharacterized transport system permease subunit
VVELHQIAAAVYLAAGIGSLLGIVLPAPRMSRGGAWGLAIGVVIHGAAFATLHLLDPPPPLTSLPVALSFSAWIAVIGLLAFMWRLRLPGLAAVVGPMAFLAVFVTALRLPHSEVTMVGAGTWPHAHVLLASAGLGLLGVAGIAGLFFLVEHRRLKAKRASPARVKLPTLEALDRVNVVALALGFPLLTLGVVTGMLWLESAQGAIWTGSGHEIWMLVAWAIYGGLVTARFAGHQGARQAAASAIAGFGFLIFAVVGVGAFL